MKFSTCYLRDWEDLLEKLHELGSLLKGATLLLANATLMYTHIDTNPGLEILHKWLEMLKRQGKLEKTTN